MTNAHSMSPQFSHSGSGGVGGEGASLLGVRGGEPAGGDEDGGSGSAWPGVEDGAGVALAGAAESELVLAHAVASTASATVTPTTLHRHEALWG